MSEVVQGLWVENVSHLCYSQHYGDGYNVTPEDTVTVACGPKDICSQKGMILPIFIEVTWPWWLRVVLYFTGLLYSFVAVFIIADIFMCSIDAITSKTKTVTVSSPDGKQETVEVPVWNGTVANLVLMSLGPRSAPEILLAIVGIMGNGFQQDTLGPSLIVGSGAFNLLVISAISVAVIPDGETRRIEMFPVFCVTMIFSIFAYLWLLIILVVNTRNKVEVWEAFATLCFIPLVVFLSWWAEKGNLDWLFCQGRSKVTRSMLTYFTDIS